MNRLLSVFAVFVAVCIVSQATAAQVSSVKNVKSVDSHYVVNDSSVIEYLLDDDEGPFKVYDFSTRQIYVKLTQKNEQEQILKVIPFTDLEPAEIDYIRDIGCEDISLSDNFRRFCQ